MKREKRIDGLDIVSLMGGLVFFSPVALLVRTQAGISVEQFFILQALLSIVVFCFEVPTGKITDKIGYRNSIILAQIMLFASRVLLFIAFINTSIFMFILEVFVEGLANCFSSGTQSAYLYTTMDEKAFVVKTARINNFGTVGFIISTISYAGMYSIGGIQGLLIATIVSSGVGVWASCYIKKEEHMEKNEQINIMNSKTFFRNLFQGKIFVVVIMLAGISMGYILINFFYVEKLQVIGIDEKWLTPIILGYSLIQLLAEKILDKLESNKYIVAFIVSFAAAGISFICFGFTFNIFITIIFMLLLPLLMDLPAYILDEIQNNMIDEIEMKDRRAEALSVFNMGVNALEIIFLFLSAILSEWGISKCFSILGVLMIIMSMLFWIFQNRKKADLTESI